MKLIGGACAAASGALIFLLLLSTPVSAATPPSMTVSPPAAIVGSKISIGGEGYPPNTSLQIEWSTVDASWIVSGNPPQVTGLNATPAEEVLTQAETDSSGSFSVSVTVPSDYGGSHTLKALSSNGTALTGKALFTLEPSFNVSPTSGPAGTPIKVVATGVGYGEYSTSYHLYWDNSYAGYFTAISTRGATNFTFYASGVVGTHYIEIYQGYPGPGYLNPQQGPPSSETQSIFPPYIPFHAQFNITAEQLRATLAPRIPEFTSSGGVASLVVLGATVAALGLFLTRTTTEKRKALGRTLAMVIIIVVIALSSAVAALAFAHAPSSTSVSTTTSIVTSTTTSVSTVTQSSSSATQGASYTPVALVVRPTISVSQNNATSGPRISVSPDLAGVGQKITVSGAGFPSNTQQALSWSTRKGSNLQGYKQVAEPLKNVTTDSSGSFSFTMNVPADLGGLHYISAGILTPHSNGTLFLQRTASINATQGPAGTVVAVTMLGVGWTFNTNIAALDYDNSYIGYGCGFNSGGNVTFYLTMTGGSGIHTIDLYPSVWWGTSNYYNQSTIEYRYPLLTPQDHPELMPSFHFSFLITSPGQKSSSSGYVITNSGLPGVTSWVVGASFVPVFSSLTVGTAGEVAKKQ